jgi:cellulose synthase/poly-beta-1,6-N-acetylglucosamine synthase-like glycosyltransferase
VLAAHGSVIAITDDDIVYAPNYVSAIWQFFSRNDCAAGQGSIRWPPETNSDPVLRDLLARYGSTLPRAEPAPGARLTTLVGANMLVRRDALLQVGLFNLRLGPGAAGFRDDDDLAERIQAGRGWIGAVPDAWVVHEISPERLTLAYFKQRHRLQGRSCFVSQPRSLPSIVHNLLRASLTLGFYTAAGHVPRRYRALGRWYHYREMLSLVLGRQPAQ